MNVYVCRGEWLVVSEPPLDQDDDDCVRMRLESTGTASVTVGNKFKGNQKTALISVQNDGRVYVVVFNENGTTRRSYDLDAVNGNITNRWETK